MSMSTKMNTVPSSMAKYNEVMMEQFDFKSNLHEEIVLNSIFYSNITEKNDEYFNEDLVSNDESFEHYTIYDIGNSDESCDEQMMNRSMTTELMMKY